MISVLSFAQEAKDLKARLRELRNEKAHLTFEYEDELHKLNRATEDKIGKFKADFHAARAECLQEKRDKAKELREGYEGKVKPLIKEEEELIRLVGPDEESNFAKTRVERQRTAR